MISADLSVGSSKMSFFTLAVMAVSSMYSPVLSDFAVAAQPRVVAMASAATAVRMRLRFVMVFLQVLHGNPCR
ncbi:hypothetical protein D3C83_229910 [compost metagenome]